MVPRCLATPRLTPPTHPPWCGRQTDPVTLSPGVQHYRTSSHSSLTPLAAVLPWGTSPPFLLCLSSAGPSSLQSGLSADTSEKPSAVDAVGRLLPLSRSFLAVEPAPIRCGETACPASRGESGQIFWERLSPPWYKGSLPTSSCPGILL